MIKNENIKQIIKKYNENKFSHIFLVETDNQEKAFLDILEVIKYINCENDYQDKCFKCNLCHLIEENSLPSLKIIIPDGQMIKKEQMESLKNDFASLPYFSKYNTYIIKNAEKFNSSSANTILKFIEEPEDKIIGFLITNSVENVIDTIKSRCEIIKSLYKDNEIHENEKIKDLAINYLKNIEILRKMSILYNLEILDLEKEEYLIFFKEILNIYVKILNEEVVENLEVLSSRKKSEILKKIDLITDVIERLNYNINMNILLDYFVLKMEEL